MENPETSRLEHVFRRVFPESKELYLASAPGRVNLIGEHTDYNDGFVMPFAVNRRVYVVCSPNQGQIVNLYSMNYDAHDSFSLPIESRSEKQWANYVRGIFHVLHGKGYRLSGMDALIYGDVPMGAGLSSSAALELAGIMAVDAYNGLDMTAMGQIRIARECENQFVGVNCGIMDPFVSRLGKKGHAMVIDCRDTSFEYIPMPSSVSIVVADTTVKHELTDGKYNERRRECEAACRILNVSSLREINADGFKERMHLLPENVRRRAAHVISENERVGKTAKAFSQGDWTTAGGLMLLSHASLRDDFAVSCPELDFMVDVAKSINGAYGCRMTGAGFGGSTVNLVDNARVSGFKKTLTRLYEKKTGIMPHIRIMSPSDGAGIIRL